MKLTESEIKERLVCLRNLEFLHIKARKRVVFLEKENKKLKQIIKELRDENKDQNGKIEAMAFQLEQIKNKLFGKKSIRESIFFRKEKKIRDTSSYTRPTPKIITEVKRHTVENCACCNGKLQNKVTKVFFVEDIPLPIEKTVTKHCVESGYCKNCLKQTSAINIPSKKTVLGENVRKYVCLLSIANRLPHSQIQNHLNDVFYLKVSIGEIGNILEKEAGKLRPEYQRLKQSVIKQEAVHYDETGWKVQREEFGKYAWVATGTETNDVIFSLGRSRGKGNIEDLGVAKVGITDDYGAYKNTFESHQLCFAHPQRKLRDLAESEQFEGRQKEQIITTYTKFSTLYQKIRERPKNLSKYLKKKYQLQFDQITENHNHDPTQLKKLKVSLLKNKEKYFTFLKYPHIPIDNNKAERALRHLVIKRKISFGSKTQRGAETTSILASIIMSLKWCDPNNWFGKYLKLVP